MNLIQKLIGLGREGAENLEQASARLSAFGKHPGWEDHIPGIGIDSELLAGIKQALYVAGIGAQIDSGAWEKLEAAKRISGFDHQFMAIFGGQTVVGCLWSSVDRLGRAKYPMVLCLEVSRLSPASAYVVANPVLTELRKKCEEARSAEEVNAACTTSLQGLREAYAGALGATPRRESDSATREAFLSAPQFGPDRIGWLRTFHELGLTEETDAGRRSDTVLARVARVPASAVAGAEPVVLWAELMQSAVPAGRPVWIIQRKNVDWLDVIAGSPSGREFFCLQASLAASPLATSVPYELPPEATERWGDAERRYLAGTRASELSPRGSATGTKPGGPSRVMLIVGAALFLTVTAGLVLMLGHHEKPQVTAVETPHGSNPPTSPGPSPQDMQYQAAMQAGQVALSSSNYDAAITNAQSALQLRAGDADAYNLLSRAQSGKTAVELAAKFAEAMAAANSSLESGKLDEAEADVQAALRTHVNDGETAKLIGSIKRQRGNVAYTNWINSAQSALARGDNNGAVTNAQQALEWRPEDAEAQRIIRQAQSQMSRAKLEEEYNQDISAAIEALNAFKLEEAAADTRAALQTHVNDEAANGVLDKIRAQHDNLEYTNRMAQANAFLTSSNYDEAVSNAQMALQLRKNDGEASAVVSRAQGMKSAGQQVAKYQAAMEAATVAFKQGNLDEAQKQVNVALDALPRDKQALALQQQIVNTRKYNSATTNANQASKSNQWDAAVADAEVAWETHVNDDEAANLIVRIKQQRDGWTYTNLIQSAQSALTSSNYDEAITSAKSALQLRGGDTTAQDIVSRALASKRDVQAARDYLTSMMTATNAFNAKNWADASNSCVQALGARPDDPRAKELLGQATTNIANANYAKSMDAAKAALAQGNYDEALNQAGEALKSHPGDIDATNLQTAATQKKNFAAAMAAGKQALTDKNYDEAVRQADMALAITNDPEATQLKADASAQQTQAKELQKYDGQLQDLMKRFGVTKKYGNVIDPSKSAKGEESHSVDAGVLTSAQDEVKSLHDTYAKNKWLDDERTKCLDAVKSATDNWLN